MNGVLHDFEFDTLEGFGPPAFAELAGIKRVLSSHRFTIIESPKGKVENKRVERLTTESFDLGSARSDVELWLGDPPLTFVSLDDPGNYVVVLFDDGKGKVKGISFYDPRFVIAG